MDKVEIVNKPWGREEILKKTNKYVMKRITITRGHRLSLQYHKVKEETIYVISGTLIIWKSEKLHDHVTLFAGQTYHVKPTDVHRFGATDQETVVILECSTTELTDVVRIADDYDRS